MILGASPIPVLILSVWKESTLLVVMVKHVQRIKTVYPQTVNQGFAQINPRNPKLLETAVLTIINATQRIVSVVYVKNWEKRMMDLPAVPMMIAYLISVTRVGFVKVDFQSICLMDKLVVLMNSVYLKTVPLDVALQLV